MELREREALREIEIAKERELAAYIAATSGGLANLTSDAPRDSLMSAAGSTAMLRMARTAAVETQENTEDVAPGGEAGDTEKTTGGKADTLGAGENPSKEETTDTATKETKSGVGAAASQTSVVPTDAVAPKTKTSAKLLVLVTPLSKIPDSNHEEIHALVIRTLDEEGVVSVMELDYPGEGLMLMLAEHHAAFEKVRGVNVLEKNIVASPVFTDANVLPFHILAIPSLLRGKGNTDFRYLDTIVAAWDQARKKAGTNSNVLKMAVAQHAKGAVCKYNACLWGAEENGEAMAYLTDHHMGLILKWINSLEAFILAKRREADLLARLQLTTKLTTESEHDIRLPKLKGAE